MLARLWLVTALAPLGLVSAAAAAPFLCATRVTSGEVVVLDLANGATAGAFAAGTLPAGAALDAAGSRLVVADAAGTSHAIVLPGGGTSALATGAAPAGVAFTPDGATVAIANSGDDTLSLFDAASGAALATVPVGDVPLAVAADAVRVVVTNYGAATVSLIDLGTLAVSAVAVGSFPAGVAIAGGRAWVANRGDDTVSVVDLATATLVTTVTVGEAPRGVTAGGGRVFVGSLNDATVSVLDVTTAAILATWALPNPSPTDLLLSTAGDRLYAAHPTADLVSVLDTATGLPLASLPAPHGLAVFAGISQLGSGAQVDIPGLTLPGLLAIAALLAALGFARLRGALLLLVLVAAAAVVPAAAEAQVSFIDDDFDDADWVIEQASVGNGSQLAEQSGFIGDPAPSRRMEHESPGTAGPPEVVAAVHRFTGGGYDPASQGAIASLDATWRRIVTLNDNGGDVEEAFVVIQGGVVFATAASAFSASFWEDAFRPGLVAADFSDGGGAHPDFSTAGAPLFFGYLRRTSNSTPFSSFVEHCIDRFEVEVDNGTPPGPGPGTLELVAFEFTGVIDPARITVVRRDGTNGPASVQVHVHRNGVSLVQDAQWADGEGGGREVTFDLLDFVGPHTLVAFDVDLEDPQPSPGGPALGRRRAMLDFSGDPALADRARLLATGPAALLVLAPLALWLAQRRRRSAAAARPPSAP